MPNELMPRPAPSQVIEVVELEDCLLDLVTGAYSDYHMNLNCGFCGQDPNTSASCGAG